MALVSDILVLGRLSVRFTMLLGRDLARSQLAFGRSLDWRAEDAKTDIDSADEAIFNPSIRSQFSKVFNPNQIEVKIDWL